MKLTKAQNQVLSSCFLFKALDEKEKAEVFEKLDIKSFQKGEAIYTQHHFQKSLGIVLEGEAAVKKDKGTLLNLLKAGSCFGAAALFAPAEEYVTSIMAQKACKVVFISGEELAQLFRKYPDMALEYIAFLSGRIQFLNKKIDSFTTPSAEDAVWQWIQTHVDDSGRAVAVGGFARLARELNIGRATLYRCLALLKQEGKITKEGAQILIHYVDLDN